MHSRQKQRESGEQELTIIENKFVKVKGKWMYYVLFDI